MNYQIEPKYIEIIDGNGWVVRSYQMLPKPTNNCKL